MGVQNGKTLKEAPAGEHLHLLCDAIGSGDIEATRKFTCGLSTVNVLDPSGRLPLVEACKVGNKDVIGWLLQEDADSVWPYLALLGSGTRSNELLRQLPSSRKVDVNTLSTGVHVKQEKLVRALLAAGVDPSAMDDDGDVPLVSACRRLSLATLSTVVEAASELDVEDGVEITSFLAAKRRGSEFADLLVSGSRKTKKMKVET